MYVHNKHVHMYTYVWVYVFRVLYSSTYRAQIGLDVRSKLIINVGHFKS